MKIAGACALAALFTAAPGEPTHGSALPAGVLYATLPFRDLSGGGTHPAGLEALLRSELEARGARFVAAEEVEAVLQDRRIRYTDSLSTADALALARRTRATHVLLGSLLEEIGGEEPSAALSLRVLDPHTGERLVSELVALRGADFTGLLGLGAVTDLEELHRQVVARLLDGFDGNGAPRSSPWDPDALAEARPSDPLTRFVDADFDLAGIEHLAILPFEDRSDREHASAVLAELLGHQLFRLGGVQSVETGEIRAAMVRAEIRSALDLDLERLQTIGRELGTHHFLLGSVDDLGTQEYVQDELMPVVEVSLRVVDAESRRIVAAAAVRRRGDEYEGLLRLGAVRDDIALANRVAAELCGAIGG